MTIGHVLKNSSQTLEKAGISSHRLDTLVLLEYASNRSREHLLANPNSDLDKKIVTEFNFFIAQRAQRVPLVHLINQREFYGLMFMITPDVLTPRVETEQMVEWAIQYAFKNSDLIDIGTGSGAIALSIAHHRPDLSITATEISPTAMTLAKKNAAQLKLNTKFIQSDLFDDISGKFSTIVTNLPYLKNDAELMPEVRREPAVALFGGNDGLELYRRFFHQLGNHLAPNGYVFIESDPWQQPELIHEAAQAGLALTEQGYFILGFQLK